MERQVYVADIDSIIDGSLRRIIDSGELVGRVLIHKSIVEFLYSEARKGRSIGMAGLDELSRLVEAEREGVSVEIVEDEREKHYRDLDMEAVKRAVRDYAWRTQAYLITSDDSMRRAAKAMRIPVIYSEKGRGDRLKIEEFFGDETMSVHLKEGAPPLAKVGAPGKWRFIWLGEAPMTREEIEAIAEELMEVASLQKEGFVEIDRRGSTIVQLRDLRVVITRPPLSEGWEITAVKPVVKLSIDDYRLPEKLKRRLLERAEGILIAGAPGMGKTTFAQALAEYYMSMGRVVKTIESPRDMRLPPEVTQYSKNYADLGELHDILLLSRPDYTFFDELRDDEDFRLYVDLRLAGIGMVGVLHATTPIDAIQRFIRRVELGMIPSIIDTVIFIDQGRVIKVYELSMTVKLPTGLREAELSRPVVEVRDYLTGELEYEVYTFGEQTMVVPVKRVPVASRTGRLESAVKKIIPEADVEVREGIVMVKIPRSGARVTARKLKRIRQLAEREGMEARFLPA